MLWGAAPPVHPPITAAAHALRDGQIVLLYDADGREEETDMVVLSQHATPETLRTLRHDAGGLVCTAVAPEHHAALGLPFLTDLIQDAASRHPALAALLPDDIQYDGSKPAFGLTINHRDTFTGITDEDRGLTISELAGFLADIDGMPRDEARAAFGERFRAPGHVHLLNGAPGGLHARQGHTELSLALARLSGATPCTTVCEMLDPATGKALQRAGAEAYAAEHGLVFLTGADVVRAWREQATAPAAVPAAATP